jgi:hypothetical protein
VAGGIDAENWFRLPSFLLSPAAAAAAAEGVYDAIDNCRGGGARKVIPRHNLPLAAAAVAIDGFLSRFHCVTQLRDTFSLLHPLSSSGHSFSFVASHSPPSSLSPRKSKTLRLI